MLLRNINKKRGLCNGTRLILKNVKERTLECYNPGRREMVDIPRIRLMDKITISSSTSICNDYKQSSRTNLQRKSRSISPQRCIQSWTVICGVIKSNRPQKHKGWYQSRRKNKKYCIEKSIGIISKKKNNKP